MSRSESQQFRNLPSLSFRKPKTSNLFFQRVSFAHLWQENIVRLEMFEKRFIFPYILVEYFEHLGPFSLKI